MVCKADGLVEDLTEVPQIFRFFKLSVWCSADVFMEDLLSLAIVGLHFPSCVELLSRVFA